jgi:hypothetical protein
VSLDNIWTASDSNLVRDSFLAAGSYLHRQVLFRKFTGYSTLGSSANIDEMIRTPRYAVRTGHVWLSQIKVFDTVKGGYFTTGDLDVASSFIIQGYSSAYTLSDGTVIPEYAGDEIVWNGKLWSVADQLEPVQAGMQSPIIFYRTTLRRSDRAGTEQGAGQ